jgi:Holliday junction resolvasome RuvABC endonuclease subunit
MNYIVGIDPGFTETGVVLYKDDDERTIIRWATYKSPAHGQAAAARAASLAECVIADLVKWIEEFHIQHLDICIEIPFLAKNVAGFQKQIRVIQELQSGILFRLAGEVLELWVTEVGPTRAKVLACNDGRATKEEIVKASPFGLMTWHQHTARTEALADAWAIGLAGWGSEPCRFNFSSVKAAKVVRHSDTD